MAKAVFYHAGCPVCVDAEQTILGLLDRSKCDIEVVHLGQERSRINEAEKYGVKSVPALVINENVLHINFDATIDDVRKG